MQREQRLAANIPAAGRPNFVTAYLHRRYTSGLRGACVISAGNNADVYPWFRVGFFERVAHAAP